MAGVLVCLQVFRPSPLMRVVRCSTIGDEFTYDMPSITAEEWQLLSFFESEPELLDPNEHWAYNDAVYRVTDGAVELSVAIQPAYRDVRIIIQNGGHGFYEFESMGIVDVRYLRDATGELLEFVIDERNSMQLRVRPTIRLHHRCQI